MSNNSNHMIRKWWEWKSSFRKKIKNLSLYIKKTARLEIQTNSNQNLFKTIIWYKFRGWNLSHCTTLKTSAAAAAAAKSLQSCPTLCDPIDGSPPGSPVPGILQARTLEWVAISFSNAWKWKVKVNSLSRVRLFATLWTAAYQAPLSMGFSRQEYWSGVPLLSPQTLYTFPLTLLFTVTIFLPDV